MCESIHCLEEQCTCVMLLTHEANNCGGMIPNRPFYVSLTLDAIRLPNCQSDAIYNLSEV